MRSEATYTWVDLTEELPQGAGWMHSGVAADPAGLIFCAHPEGGALVKINLAAPSGRRTRTIDTGFAELHGIALTRHPGVLGIADPGYRMESDEHHHYVERWTPGRAALIDATNGAVLRELPDPSPQSGWRPTSIATSPRGDIWVADGYGQSLVHHFDRFGRIMDSFDGSASNTRFNCPHGIMTRPRIDGHGAEIVVADRANRRIVTLTERGDLIAEFGADVLDSPSSLVMHRGELFVTELHGGIARFSRSNEFLGTIEASRARHPGEPGWPNSLENSGALCAPNLSHRAFNSPHGIASDGASLFVTEWLIGGRLLQITPKWAD